MAKLKSFFTGFLIGYPELCMSTREIVCIFQKSHTFVMVVTFGLHQGQNIFGAWLKSAETDMDLCTCVNVYTLKKKKNSYRFYFSGLQSNCAW